MADKRKVELITKIAHEIGEDLTPFSIAAGIVKALEETSLHTFGVQTTVTGEPMDMLDGDGWQKQEVKVRQHKR